MTDSDTPNAADAANIYINLVEISLNIEALIQVINEIDDLVARVRSMAGFDAAKIDAIASSNARQRAMLEHYQSEIKKLR